MASSKTIILPKDWVILESKRFPGKSYYFNVLTRAASWKFPEISKESSDITKINPKTMPKTNDKISPSVSNEIPKKEENDNIHISEKNNQINENKKTLKCKNTKGENFEKNDQIRENLKSLNLENSKSNSCIKTNDEKLNENFFNDPSKTIESSSESIRTIVMKYVDATTRQMLIENKYITCKNSNKNYSDKFIKDNENDIISPIKRIGDSNINHSFSNDSNKSFSPVSPNTIYDTIKNKRKLNSKMLENCINELDYDENSKRNKIDADEIASNVSLSSFSSTSFFNSYDNTDKHELADSINVNDFNEIKEIGADYVNDYFLVLDTSILLTELNSIDILKDMLFKDEKLPHIFIPGIIFSELSLIKDKGKTSQIKKAASDAIEYLNILLNSKHPKIHGQNLLKIDENLLMNNDCNDIILHYCLTLSKIVPLKNMILLANNKMLSNKALFHNIKVDTPQSLITSLNSKKANFGSLKMKSDSFISTVVDKSLNPIIVSKAWKNILKYDKLKRIKRYLKKYEAEIRMLLIAKENVNPRKDIILCDAKRYFMQVLAIFNENQLKASFGDAWKIVIIKPPFSLSQLLESILSHWERIYSQILPNHVKELFIYLQEKCSPYQIHLNNKDPYLEILTAIEDLLCQIHVYSPDFATSMDKIIILKNEYKVVVHDSSIIDHTLTSTESEYVLHLFEYIWNLMNYLCGMIMDKFSIQHNFSSIKPDKIPSEMELKLLISNLDPSIHQLKQYMQKALHSDEDIDFKNLHKALLSFIPSLNIAGSLPHIEYFTYKILKRFCLNSQKRELCKKGCNQLEDFSNKLKEVLQDFTSLETIDK